MGATPTCHLDANTRLTIHTMAVRKFIHILMMLQALAIERAATTGTAEPVFHHHVAQTRTRCWKTSHARHCRRRPPLTRKETEEMDIEPTKHVVNGRKSWRRPLARALGARPSVTHTPHSLCSQMSAKTASFYASEASTRRLFGGASFSLSHLSLTHLCPVVALFDPN